MINNNQWEQKRQKKREGQSNSYLPAATPDMHQMKILIFFFVIWNQFASFGVLSRIGGEGKGGGVNGGVGVGK